MAPNGEELNIIPRAGKRDRRHFCDGAHHFPPCCRHRARVSAGKAPSVPPISPSLKKRRFPAAKSSAAGWATHQVSASLDFGGIRLGFLRHGRGQRSRFGYQGHGDLR